MADDEEYQGSRSAQFGYYVVAATVFFAATVSMPAIPVVMGYPSWIGVPFLLVGAFYTAIHIRAAYRVATQPR